MTPSIFLRSISSHTIVFILLGLLTSCGRVSTKTEYPENVGDITPDPKIDDPQFVPCNEKMIYQYYNFGKGLQYAGEKPKVNEHFQEELTAKEQPGQSGFLTIRFVVNCKGNIGRFRVQGMDSDYNEKKFDTDLVDRYLSLTKKMDGWIPGENGPNKFDYYQYLTFKLDNGKLIEVMP